MIDSHFPSPGKQSDNLKEIEEEILINEKKRKSVQNLHNLLQEKNCKLRLRSLELTEKRNKRQNTVDSECEQLIHHLTIQINKFTQRYQTEQAQCQLIQERMKYIQEKWEEIKRLKNNKIMRMKFDINLTKAKIRELEKRTHELEKFIGENYKHVFEMELEKLTNECNKLKERRDELNKQIKK